MPSAPGAPALTAAERSGAAAVERAVIEKDLKTSELTVAATAAEVRQVGPKTFVRQGDLWLDTAFDPSQMQPEAIRFGSDRYFELLTRYPDIGRYLALGEQLVIVLEGKAIAIGSTGEAAPLPATPVPMPTTANPAEPTRPASTPTASPPVSPTPAGQPLPLICPGAGVIVLASLLLPAWKRFGSGR